ncbi:MAG: hypothetical protein HONBIEJF_00924 [Fimbriimonadaceae bacterium]|nr:hypothetical protein [Fimbriimonadaceae bacterium]
MELSHSGMLLTFLSVASVSQAAFSVTTYSASSWAASDAVIGVSGFTIEGFEDVNLVSGLEVGVTSPNGDLVRTGVLPNTFKPSDDAFGNAFTLGGGGVWDGDHGIINTRTNQTFSYFESGSWGTLTFYFTDGALSAGFSVQQMDRDAYIVVNGSSIGTVQTLTSGFFVDNGRQGYLRIDASEGDVIQSLAIQDAFGLGDGYMFDHVAFSPVPEPATMAAISLGAMVLLRRRR